jgi:hypothetical protein
MTIMHISHQGASHHGDGRAAAFDGRFDPDVRVGSEMAIPTWDRRAPAVSRASEV